MGKKRVSLELFISLMAVTVAAFSAYASYESVRQSGQIAKFQAFLMLRVRFMEIQSTFPADYREPCKKYPVGSKEWLSLSTYWYETFNEWAITTRFGHRGMKDLWENFYKGAICNALEKNSMRDVFLHLRDNRFKSPMERQFMLEVGQICPEKLKGGCDE